MKRKFKYAIFDKDGVLTDSMPTHYVIFDAVAREFLGQKFSQSEFYRNYVGVDWRKSLKNYIKSEDQYQRFANAFHERVVPAIKDTPLYPEVMSVIKYLNKSAYRLFITSSAPQETIDNLMARDNLKPYFLLARGRGDESANKRDHIQEFSRLCQVNVDTFAAEAFIIEDMVHGIEAAKELGLFAIGLETSLTAPELKAAGADVVLPNHAALLDYLKENL